jgi:hypothetical protein
MRCRLPVRLKLVRSHLTRRYPSRLCLLCRFPKSSIPDRDVFYVARPGRSIAKFTEPEKTFLYMDLL